ncbi:50S ribosomal protein L11 methyltransferase [Pseudomonas stutzeri]|uniref:SAM-dependent methyltransferase n=1 Tax=Stutzerimonas stutzeri TaxID=316 RepID=A0A2N8S5Z1_STUST|nr:methyltransferase domain-containing protein [Stutzerimonas stutzeri]MCQ4297019.1 50S ribosomal protein L11 methyltransferase [Stutzerimonas stutzeri]PNF82031.1 SAM-dependent methyltransferase [Stutzerimonas stutzeri]
MSLVSVRRPVFLIALPFLLATLFPAHAQVAPELDVPYVPTPDRVVARMLEMADVKSGDTVIDLGSGDGRIAIAAVRDRGADSALGIDLDPERIEEAEANAKSAGVSDKVSFEQGDLFKKDISEATVLTMYLLPRINLRLRPVILDTLKPGTRVVSHAFGMDDWPADRTDYVGGSYVYLWIVPAKVEGRWEVETPDGSFVLDLQQQYQQVLGIARSGGLNNSVVGNLEGDIIHFEIGGTPYVGRVEGDRISALKGEGSSSNWNARRS